MTLQEEIEIRRKRFIDVSAELVEAEASAIKAEGEKVKNMAHSTESDAVIRTIESEVHALQVEAELAEYKARAIKARYDAEDAENIARKCRRSIKEAEIQAAKAEARAAEARACAIQAEIDAEAAEAFACSNKAEEIANQAGAELDALVEKLRVAKEKLKQKSL